MSPVVPKVMISTPVTPMISTSVISIIDVSKENNSGLMIPSIQRDYKWGPGHTDNDELNAAAHVFLEDMIDFYKLRRTEDEIYFTGTLIVFEEDGEDRTQLMDGQQRWTTITALMGVIRHILGTNKKSYYNIISEIEQKFLRLDDGSSFLQSKRKSDKSSIDFIVNLERNEKVTDAPKSYKNVYTFKREKKKYNGTSINCVIEYYFDRLSKVFGVRGSNSDLSKLVDFYEVISNKVFVNYTHTISPILAYKMFVTANSRGTPLNNYDVFRGLVLAHNRIKEYGEEKELQWELDQADEILQELYGKQKDYGKSVDKAMSDAMTVLQGEKISPNHVMSRLEHTISQFDTREELNDLVEFFEEYFLQLQKIENQSGKIGRLQNLRMQYFKFQQQIQYYAAARVFWGEKSTHIDDLMNTLEIIVVRKLVLMDGRISALFYSIAPKHFSLIRDAGTDSVKQEECVEKIRKQFEKANENPSDGEIINNLETRKFNLEKTGDKNKVIIALICLQNDKKYANFRFSTNQGNPKVMYFMPKYNGTDRGFNYPVEWYLKEDYPQLIGNCFLLSERLTQTELRKIPEEKSKRWPELHNKGKEFNNSYQNVVSIPWGAGEIDARSKNLAKLLVARFPKNCKR